MTPHDPTPAIAIAIAIAMQILALTAAGVQVTRRRTRRRRRARSSAVSPHALRIMTSGAFHDRHACFQGNAERVFRLA